MQAAGWFILPPSSSILSDMGKWKLTHNFDKIKRNLRKDGQAVCDETALAIANRAQELVPQPGHSRGYALSALKYSIHVLSKTHDGYTGATDAARSVPGSRVDQRDQVLPKITLTPYGPNHFLSLVDVPLTYALPIHDGFYHVRANRFITGTTFLYSAANDEREIFLQRVIAIMELMGVAGNIGGKAGKTREQQYSLDYSRARGQVRTERSLMNDQLTAKYGHYDSESGSLAEYNMDRANYLEGLLGSGELWD